MRTMSRRRARSTVRMRSSRAALAHRCDGLCEKCGGWLRVGDDGRPIFEAHHRLKRSQGGDDSLANQLAVHPGCHNMHRESIHDNPAESLACGWLLRRGQAPDDAPVLYRGEWARLHTDGTVTFLPDFDEVPA